MDQIAAQAEKLNTGFLGFLLENWVWLAITLIVLGFLIDQAVYVFKHKAWRRWMHNLRVCRRFLEMIFNTKLPWPPDVAPRPGQNAAPRRTPPARAPDAQDVEELPDDPDAPVIKRREAPARPMPKEEQATVARPQPMQPAAKPVQPSARPAQPRSVPQQVQPVARPVQPRPAMQPAPIPQPVQPARPSGQAELIYKPLPRAHTPRPDPQNPYTQSGMSRRPGQASPLQRPPQGARPVPPRQAPPVRPVPSEPTTARPAPRKTREDQ